MAGDSPRIPIFNCPLAMCTLSTFVVHLYFLLFPSFHSSPLKHGHEGCIDIEKSDQVQVFPPSVKSNVKANSYGAEVQRTVPK